MATDQRVIALVKYGRKGASSRVRFWNLVPALQAKGWKIDVWPLLPSSVLAAMYLTGSHAFPQLVWYTFRRLTMLLMLRGQRIMWVEKELLHGLPAVVERALVGSRIRSTVVDYDDAVFLNYRDANLGFLGRAAKFRHYARSAARITVGSRALALGMQELGCKRLRHIPSTVCVKNYPIHRHEKHGTVVIGWIGTPKTVHFLNYLKSVLPVVAKRAGVQVRVVGANWCCDGVDVVSLPWSEEAEAELVSTFDIGVMPLLDGPWERAKCGYKLIQYMAAGVVPVGSRVGENVMLIDCGVNGYLASAAEEWVEKLTLLCRNPGLRSAVGARARKTAIEKYDIGSAAQAVHEVFTEVVNGQTDDSR